MTDAASPRQTAVLRAVRELEQHVAAGGWDAPVRLFALVRTAGALDADPALATQLPEEVVVAARADAEHLTAVEQEDLPEAETLEALLGQVAWPATVDGAAVVVERLVLSPAVEAEVEAAARREGLDEADVAQRLAQHPDRRDLRLAAGVLRDGTAGCAVRARDLDDDDRVATGPDLVPALVEALRATLD